MGRTTWIESHQSLRAHPKTRRLAQRIGSRPAAIGHLHCLWWWCLDFAPDGDLTKYNAEDIALACDWPGDPDEIVRHLVETGFLTQRKKRVMVHDWYDFAGKLLVRKQANAKRMADARAAHVQRTCKTRAEREDLHTLKENHCSSEAPDEHHLEFQVGHQVEDFDRFWSIYPRREAKKPAGQCWRRLSKSDRKLALAAAEKVAGAVRASGRPLKMVPLPTTWLNQRRFEDWATGAPAGYETTETEPEPLSQIEALHRPIACWKCGAEITPEQHADSAVHSSKGWRHAECGEKPEVTKGRMAT